MRKFTLLVGLLVVAGCGSDSEQPGDAGPQQAASSESTSAAGKSGGTAGASRTQKTVQALIERGKEYINQRNAGKAIESLSQAIGLDAENSEAYYQRARANALARQDATALADYSAAIKLDPQRARLYYSRGYFYLTRKLADKSIADLEKAVELDPKQIEAWQFLGLAHVAKKEFRQAIAIFDKAVKIEPQNSDVFNNRGFTWLRSKQFEKALKDFQQAIQLKPESVNPYVNMGLTYFAMEDYQKSVGSFSKAIELSPNNPNLYAQRRQAFLKLGMQKQANADRDKLAWLKKLAVLNIAVARQPRKASHYVERAHHLLDGGEEKVALTSFNQAVKVDPDDARALSARAAYWLGKGDLDRVIDDCTNAIDANPNEPNQEAHSVRGDAWLQKGDYDRAIADFTKARRIDATVAQAYLMQAKALKREGKDDEAQQSFERAVSLDPGIENSQQ